MSRVGFMQGRLSPLVDGRIQAFPWRDWEAEYPQAAALGLSDMEWTLDDDRLFENPLLMPAGRARIAALGEQYGVRVASLTADFMMQAPFWKVTGLECAARTDRYVRVLDACAAAGVRLLVVPLVDNGRIETDAHAAALVSGLEQSVPLLRAERMRVAFESDFPPDRLADFVAPLAPELFGINYDIGNSAALGYDAAEELQAYGRRVIGLHVKDRTRGGGTVPLGDGDADFETVFAGLAAAGYDGEYILQTARAADGDHAGALRRFAAMTSDWVALHAR